MYFPNQFAGLRLWPGVLLLGLLFLSCSTGKPDRDDCLAAHKHNLALLKELPPKLRDIALATLGDPTKEEAFIQSCLTTKTAAQLKCELSATTFKSLKTCTPQK